MIFISGLVSLDILVAGACYLLKMELGNQAGQDTQCLFRGVFLPF